jgi:Ribose/Galactose Isomerase
VAIGSDHAGFEWKEAVKTFLVAEHHETVDVGRPGVEGRARHAPLRQRHPRVDGREQDSGHWRRPVPPIERFTHHTEVAAAQLFDGVIPR